MKINRLALLAIPLIFIVGCSSLFGSSASQTEEAGSEVNEDGLMSVAEYTGEQYGLEGYEEEERIAISNPDEVEEAAKWYMKEFYNTEIEIQQMFGSPEAVTVFVRSLEEPVFTSFVVVPIDVESGRVNKEHTFSDPGQVEGAIKTGIYAHAYREELVKLEEDLAAFAEENDLIGLKPEAVTATRFMGYSTPHFYVVVSNGIMDPLLEAYINGETYSSEEWKEMLEKEVYESNYITISIHLFEKGEGEPSLEKYEKLRTEIIENENLSQGTYDIYFYSNKIEPITATGDGEGSLKAYQFDDIIKKAGMADEN